MALWNQKNLPAPPTNTYKSKTKDLDLVKLRNALQDCMKHFKNEDFMIRETALLSRILYRMKMKFRSAKEFKSLEKINHSLHIYLNENMSRDLKNIFDLIPTNYQIETYLPTRNMLSYILVRIQGLVKLMERIYDTCQVAAYEIDKRLAIGHFWKIYIVLFSLVSRISVLVKFNTKLLCELYGKLLPHSNKLENTGRNWLPDEYDLPGDLREWLGVQWVYEEEFIDLTFERSMKILDFFDLVSDDDDDEVQFCDEYVLISEEDINIANDFKKLKPVEETFTRNRMRGFSINEDDIGEDIADIIKSNASAAENIDFKNTDNVKEIKSRSNISNKKFELEDIGEEISDTENSTSDGLKMINLDETEYNLNSSINKIKDYKKNDDCKQLPKKGSFKKKKNKLRNNKNDTVINIDDSVVLKDNEVIVIPETPRKEIHKNLKDPPVILLDDTLVLSKTTSDSILNSNKNLKKKNKEKSKKIKKALQYSSPISNNFLVNVIDKENKNVSLDTINTYLSLNSSDKETPQSPSRKKKIKSPEKTLKRPTNKRKNDDNYISAQKKRKRENEETVSSKQHVTKSQKQDENNSDYIKSKKKRKNKETTASNQHVGKFHEQNKNTNNSVGRETKRKNEEASSSKKRVTKSQKQDKENSDSVERKRKRENVEITPSKEHVTEPQEQNKNNSNSAKRKRKRKNKEKLSSKKHVIKSHTQDRNDSDSESERKPENKETTSRKKHDRKSQKQDKNNSDSVEIEKKQEYEETKSNKKHVKRSQEQDKNRSDLVERDGKGENAERTSSKKHITKSQEQDKNNSDSVEREANPENEDTSSSKKDATKSQEQDKTNSYSAGDENSKNGGMVDNGSISLSLNDSNNQAPQSSSGEKKIEPPEKPLNQLGETNNLHVCKNEAKKRRTQNHEKTIFNKNTIVLTKEEKKVLIENSSEYKQFTGLCHKLERFLKRPRKKKKKKKIKKNQDNNTAGPSKNEEDNFKHDKEKANIVRLNLVKEIPTKEHVNQKEDSPGPSQSREKFKTLEFTNLKLIPCLETPLKCTLNIDSKTTNEKASSSSRVSPEENIYKIPVEMPGSKESEKKKEKERQFEESCTLETTENSKEFKKEKEVVEYEELQLIETDNKSFTNEEQRKKRRSKQPITSKFFRQDPNKTSGELGGSRYRYWKDRKTDRPI